MRLHIEKDGQQITWVLVFSVLSIQAHGRHSILDDQSCEFFLAPFVPIFPFIPVLPVTSSICPFLGVQDNNNFQSMVWELLGVPRPFQEVCEVKASWFSEVICFPSTYGWAFQRLHDPWYHDNWMRNRLWESSYLLFSISRRFGRPLSSLNLFCFEKQLFFH